MIHDNSEKVKAIKDTQKECEKAMKAVISYLQTAEIPTCQQAHQIIDEVLTKNNCESPEGHIVSGGTQSTDPHEFGTGVLEKGTPIIIDIYPRSKVSGYFADMSRTVCIGNPPAELQKMYDTVLAAQKIAISMIKPKASCSDIQNAVENYFKEKGYITSGKGNYFPYLEGFVHGVGHGVGLEIHESPRIGRNTTDILEEGDVVTVEPGLYYSPIGGVRIEDMVLVTKHGPKNLTNFPKKLEI